MKILIIEDDKNIANIEKAYLEREKYEVVVENDGLAGLERFRSDTFDLVLLDRMLPSMSGEDVCREIKRESHVPIVMVTAKTDEDNIVAGLDMGADDYITKPFKNRELVARVKARLRSAAVPAGEKKDKTTPEEKNIIRLGKLVIDVDNGSIHKDGKEVYLTRNEFLIFSKMASRPSRTWKREDLIAFALGDEYGDPRSIDSYIKNIRKKLADPEHENGYIHTVHGFGYRISEDGK